MDKEMTVVVKIVEVEQEKWRGDFLWCAQWLNL